MYLGCGNRQLHTDAARAPMRCRMNRQLLGGFIAKSVSTLKRGGMRSGAIRFKQSAPNPFTGIKQLVVSTLAISS